MADNKEALPSLGWLIKHSYLGPHTVWCGHNSVADYRDADPGATSTELTSLPAATAAISELRAEVERYKADAERYRWLRDYSEPGICAFYLSVGKAFDGVRFARATVDEAIDAQIAARSAASGESAEGGV